MRENIPSIINTFLLFLIVEHWLKDLHLYLNQLNMAVPEGAQTLA